MPHVVDRALAKLQDPAYRPARPSHALPPVPIGGRVGVGREERSRYFSGVFSTSRRSTAQRRPGASILHAGGGCGGWPIRRTVEAREIGLVLAAHASVAASTVHERTALEQLGGQLHDALSSRDVIGQAKGILMERLRITPDDAFDALRRASQRLNLKLREIAQNLVETGEFADDTDRS